MITNSEQKLWHPVPEVNASRAKSARVRTDAESKVYTALLEQTARFTNVEASTQNVVLRVQNFESEFRSAQTEAYELSARIFQQGLESEISL